jgi:4-alpha-glucanotransferase
MTRSSGILLHPSSLPGRFGIGDFGKGASDFVELLAASGQSLWQVLPLGPTGFGDSPYSPFSSFAGNELFISPEILVSDGLLARSELRRVPGFPLDRVDYGRLIPWKRGLLMRAAEAFFADADSPRRSAFEAFAAAQAGWLPDYALFRAIKEELEAEGRSGSWNRVWPETLRDRTALAEDRERFAGGIRRWKLLQFLFAQQWASLKARARSRGIRVIGDLPIFVAEDSAEVWARRALFLLDARGLPTSLAGVPPDYFSEDGQLWGNPLYDWPAHAREGYAWWISRLSAALERFDAVRVDHFRGFEACWELAAGSRTARRGRWSKGPGAALFEAVEAQLGPGLPVIAEDLGVITKEVRDLRDGFGFPGMRILQFAFDAAESGVAFDPRNAFLPHNYVESSVVYTGTHDNDTLAGWLAQASGEERGYLHRYLGHDPEDPVWALVLEALKSVAAWAIIPMQDLLGLGTEARMNRPSTLGGNWAWRMAEGDFSDELAARLKSVSGLYARNLDAMV